MSADAGAAMPHVNANIETNTPDMGMRWIERYPLRTMVLKVVGIMAKSPCRFVVCGSLKTRDRFHCFGHARSRAVPGEVAKLAVGMAIACESGSESGFGRAKTSMRRVSRKRHNRACRKVCHGSVSRAG